MLLKPLVTCFIALISQSSSLVVKLEKSDRAFLSEAKLREIPRPILGTFAEHLNSLSSLFTSLVGYKPDVLAVNDESSSVSEIDQMVESAIDCSDNVTPAGPYCLINYKNSTCEAVFGCNFSKSPSNLPEGSQLCCSDMESEFSSEFIDSIDAGKHYRFFLANQNNVGEFVQIGDLIFQIRAGFYGISELVYNPKVAPAEHLNLMEGWTGCDYEDDGYYNIDLVPYDAMSYTSVNADSSFLQNSFSLCAATGEDLNVKVNGEGASIMPYCTFKIAGQDCPSYAPLELSFNNKQKLPNDNIFKDMTFLDTSNYCCAMSEHKATTKTVINLDWLDENQVYSYFQNTYQVLKWPFAPCAEFVYPKMDLKVETVQASGLNVYPFAYGDMDLTFCTYTKPEDASVGKKVETDEKEIGVVDLELEELPVLDKVELNENEAKVPVENKNKVKEMTNDEEVEDWINDIE